MKVWELKELLSDVDDEMDVFMPFGEKDIIPACRQSDVITIEFDDGEVEALLIIPCTCNVEDAPIDIEINEN